MFDLLTQVIWFYLSTCNEWAGQGNGSHFYDSRDIQQDLPLFSQKSLYFLVTLQEKHTLWFIFSTSFDALLSVRTDRRQVVKYIACCPHQRVNRMMWSLEGQRDDEHKGSNFLLFMSFLFLPSYIYFRIIKRRRRTTVTDKSRVGIRMWLRHEKERPRVTKIMKMRGVTPGSGSEEKRKEQLS